MVRQINVLGNRGSEVWCGPAVSQATLMHGVPRTMLYSRMSGRVAHKFNPVPKPYLLKYEAKDF